MLASLRQTRSSAAFHANPQPLRVFIRNAGRSTGHSDPKVDVLRRALYPPNIRLRETPTGAWRRDVARVLRYAIPSAQAHETIERAWLLRERHLRWKRDAESARKFECMRRAMAELHSVNVDLYNEANKTEDSRILAVAEVEAMKSQRKGDIVVFVSGG